MPEANGKRRGREISGEPVDIAPAHAGHCHAHENLASARRHNALVLDSEGTVRSVKDHDLASAPAIGEPSLIHHQVANTANRQDSSSFVMVTLVLRVPYLLGDRYGASK
jgi:hypothetical protein